MSLRRAREARSGAGETPARVSIPSGRKWTASVPAPPRPARPRLGPARPHFSAPRCTSTRPVAANATALPRVDCFDVCFAPRMNSAAQPTRQCTHFVTFKQFFDA